MIALYILGGLLFLILLILIVPVRLRVTYDQTLTARLRILFVIPYTLYDERKPEKPKKEKAESEKPAKEKKEKKRSVSHLFKERAQDLKARGAAGLLDWLRDVARFVLGATKRLLRAITVRGLTLQMRVVGDDAASTAIACGRWCAAAYPLLGTLMCAIRTKRSDVRIEPDFLGTETSYAADVRLSISPWRVLFAAVWALAGYLRLTKPAADATLHKTDYRREQKIKRAAEKKIKQLEKQKQQKEAS